SNGADFGRFVQDDDFIITGTQVHVINSQATKLVRFNGGVKTPQFNADAGPYDLQFAGSGTDIGTDPGGDYLSAVLLNTGMAIFGDGNNDILMFRNGLFVETASSVELYGWIYTQASPVTLGDGNTPVNLRIHNSVIDTTAAENPLYLAGDNITFGGVIEGMTSAASENLDLNAGNTGDIVYLGAVGGSRRIGTMLVRNARNVGFPNVTAERLVQVTGTGTTTLLGVVNTDSTGCTHPGLTTNVGDIVSGAADPTLPGVLATRSVDLGVDIRTVTIVVNAEVSTLAGGVWLCATTGSNGVVTLNNNGIINSDLDVILEGNAPTGPAIVVNAAASWRLGLAGEDVLVGTRRRFLTTSDADVEFRGNVSMVAGPLHAHADIFFVDTGSGAGHITFTGDVELNYSDLDVRSGLGNINFRGPVTEVHRLFLQDPGDGTLGGASETTVTFVRNLSTELLITAPGSYNVDLLGSSSVINLNQIQYYLPGGTTFRNTGRVTLGNDSSDVVSVIFALSTTAATVTNIAGTVELGYGMGETAQPGIALSPVRLTPAGTTAQIRTNSWWPITVAADASGNSVTQAGNNTLVLGTGISRNEYIFIGGVAATSLVTTLSTERYNVSILGSLNITGAGGTTFNNRGALRIGGASANVHQLNGSLTVATNVSLTLSGQLTANGNVAVTPRVTAVGAGPALLAANGGTLTIGDVFISSGVNLTLGSATTNSISTALISGTAGIAAGSLLLQSAGSITIANSISGLADLTLLNSAGADFRESVSISGNLQMQNSTGTVWFRGSIGAGAITANAGAFDLQLPAGVYTAGVTSLLNTGTVTFGDGPNMFGNPDAFQFAGGFNRSGGATQVFGDFRTTNTPLTIAGTLTAIGNSVLRSGSGLLTLANVVLNSGISLDLGAGDSGSMNLTTVGVASGATGTRLRINSGGTVTVAPSGTITGVANLDLFGNTSVFNGDVGTPSNRVGQITRSTSGATTFNGNLYAVGFADSSSGALSFLGANTDVINAVALGTNNTVTLGNGGDLLNFAGGLASTVGTAVINGTVTTSNSPISLGAVTVSGTATLNSGLGAGDIDMWAVSGSGNLTVLSGQGHSIFRSTVSGIANLTILQAANVDFRGMVTLSGNLTQSAVPGTGTTILRGATVGGTVNLQTSAVSLASGTLTVSGSVTLGGTGSVSMASGANIDAGSSIVRISAGSGGFTQNGTSTITSSSNDTTAAIQVLVAGGNATLGGLTASHASGRVVVTITGTGSILDGNDTGTTTPINTTGSAMVLSAAGGTIGTAANPLEYSSGTVTTPVNGSTTIFVRDATPNAGSVIGRYDFGRSTLVQDRFRGVSSATIFSSTVAYSKSGSYGFVTRPSEVLRSTTGLGKTSINLYADSVIGTSAVNYRVRLPSNSAGPYLVRAYFGDRDMSTNTVITGVSGTTITSGSLASNLAGPLAFPMMSATVSDTDADGILTFEFNRPTGYTGYWSVIGMDIATGALPDAAPQVLAGLDFVAGGALSDASKAHLAAVERRGEVLSEELILQVREQVLAAWATTGLSADAMALLQSATVEIRDMNDRGMLGASGAAGTSEIWLDDDALGYGWSFTDDADLDGDGLADIDVPEGTVDLATVMAHEYGHLLGWQDLDPQEYAGHLMSGELSVGERRGVDDLAAVFRGVEAEVQDVSVPMPVQRVDVFVEKERVEAGSLISAGNQMPSVAVAVRKVKRAEDQDVAGDVILPQQSTSDVDIPLSLLDDLFADLSLLP
ncbi:MAG: beta strand repeat-containing protein, partial [Planctomycetota bacterium]